MHRDARSRFPAAACLAAAACAGVVVGCAAPWPQGAPPPSPALHVPFDVSPLAAMARRIPAGRAGESGVYALAAGPDAFVARLVLVDAAQSSLDFQYYRWNDDATGLLLLDHAVAAADRGVRVRILLDDWGNDIDGETLRLLAAHPNVHVRLFNPTSRGVLGIVASVLDYGRLTRRMHNKSLTADGHVAIVGGRNVGDEYFGAGSPADFADLDAMLVGPAAADVARQFERFWDCPLAVPIAAIVPDEPAERSFAGLRERLALAREDAQANGYLDAVARDTLAQDLRDGTVSWLWGTVRTVHDDPRASGPGSGADAGPGVGAVLGPALQGAQREVIVVSPYLVPGRAGIALFAELNARGVRIRALTNSLATTDVVAAHAAYARYRPALLDAGVELHETRPARARPRHRHHQIDLHEIGASESGALHAKVYGIDRAAVFVGSFNLDPRSRRLNTELGVMIEIPVLAERLAAGFDEIAERHAWRVVSVPATPTEPARLEWSGRDREGRTVQTAEEPGGEWWLQLRAFLMALLPIEDEL